MIDIYIENLEKIKDQYPLIYGVLMDMIKEGKQDTVEFSIIYNSIINKRFK